MKPAKPVSVTDERTEKFWALVERRDGCWGWTGGTDDHGYARFSGYRANRYSFALHYFPPPCDRMICHTCDNPQCVNPAHLVLGTNQENINDASDKGLIVRPDRTVANAGITERGLAKTMEVLELWGKGESVRDISIRLKMPAQRVRYAIRQYANTTHS